MIPVTKPFLPPRDEYQKYLEGIWQRNWLTNNGPLVKELEESLRQYFNVSHLLYLSNGTIAIQIAIKALELEGEIITTPFSYVATTSSIVWENCRPVFSDIDPQSFNIDPEKIEALITKRTSAILATHCFGNPCDIDAIEDIARKHNLKVIYDAAHCFGSMYKGKSVFSYGDVSTTSFHATKLFHTIEGGAVFANEPDLIRRMAYMRNFGHAGPENFDGVGINGKNSEFHAAMGLCLLPYVTNILEKRKNLSNYYDAVLSDLYLVKPAITKGAEFNYSYYPVVLEDETLLVSCMDALNKNDVFPRRYFYPGLNTLNYVDQRKCPVSDDISNRILCLPLYHDLQKKELEMIAEIINKTIKELS